MNRSNPLLAPKSHRHLHYKYSMQQSSTDTDFTYPVMYFTYPVSTTHSLSTTACSSPLPDKPPTNNLHSVFYALLLWYFHEFFISKILTRLFMLKLLDLLLILVLFFIQTFKFF
ncbi:hypothetical protein DPMN_067573 [Dreissena polymorpha]|uniref:Uncharacterized protein n=1 Tax=Dreissena polymorpha TaxID=45954 RepID=A0A9D3Z0Z2_DREPO|nr:hypothetical protein DPMN_067573 [Dreissena polymorpha]